MLEGLEDEARVAILDANPASPAADLSLSLGCIGSFQVSYLAPYSLAVPPSVDTYIVGIWDEETGSWMDGNLGRYGSLQITDDGSAIYVSNRAQVRQIVGILATAAGNLNPDLVLNVGMFDSENEEGPSVWAEFDPTGLEDALRYLPCF